MSNRESGVPSKGQDSSGSGRAPEPAPKPAGQAADGHGRKPLVRRKTSVGRESRGQTPVSTAGSEKERLEANRPSTSSLPGSRHDRSRGSTPVGSQSQEVPAQPPAKLPAKPRTATKPKQSSKPTAPPPVQTAEVGKGVGSAGKQVPPKKPVKAKQATPQPGPSPRDTVGHTGGDPLSTAGEEKRGGHSCWCA